MVEGWIKLHRQITENELWLSEPFSRSQAWVDLLLIANHSDGVIRRRGIKITVKRGQVGMSQDTLANRWGWSKNKVRRFLKELVDSSQIELKTELKNIAVSTLITITNYELYQGNGTENETKEKPKTKLKTAPEQECKEGKEENIIPDWIPFEEWKGFVDMRKSIRKPMTDRAVRLAISTLEKLKEQGEDISEVLNQSVLKSYTGLFPVRHDNSNQRQGEIIF